MDESHSTVRRRKCIFKRFTGGSFAISVRISEFLGASFFHRRLIILLLLVILITVSAPKWHRHFEFLVSRREILQGLWCV